MLTTALFQTLMNVPRQATVATAAPPVRILLVRTHASVGVDLVETATAAQVQLLKHLLSAICFCSVCCNNRFAVLRFCNHSYGYGYSCAGTTFKTSPLSHMLL